MNHFLVVFRVLDPGREAALIAELETSSSWWRSDFPGVWMVCTAEGVQALYQRCRDHLLLLEEGGDLLWVRFQPQQILGNPVAQLGWLPQGAWNWLQGHHL